MNLQAYHPLFSSKCPLQVQSPQLVPEASGGGLSVGVFKGSFRVGFRVWGLRCFKAWFRASVSRLLQLGISGLRNLGFRVLGPMQCQHAEMLLCSDSQAAVPGNPGCRECAGYAWPHPFAHPSRSDPHMAYACGCFREESLMSSDSCRS